MDSQMNKLIADIVKKSEVIAKALKNGDVEIRKGQNGVTITEVRKKIIAR